MIRFALALVCLAVATPALAQETYVPPKNNFGQPDLQGLWTNATMTLLERQTSQGERLVMTPEEVARLEGGPPNPLRGRDGFVAEPGGRVMDVNGEKRTSFLVEPKDGQLPDLTPEARRAREARMAAMFPKGAGFGRGDNPESMTLAERCLKDFGSSSGPPMMPVGYNNTYQIVQTPDAVMIMVEMIHDVRIVPLSKERMRPAAVKQWMGDSIGWYEGDTLVVETTNFRPGQAFRGAPETVKLVERFRRINETQLLYSFAINDPKVFAAPIKAEIAMNATKGPIFEYACHEGNYSQTNILGGQRVADAEMATLAKKRK